MFQRIRVFLVLFGLLVTFKVAGAQPPPGWNHMGTITNVFIGNGYGSSPNTPKILFMTSDGGKYYFALSTTELYRTWVTQVLAAKSNGQTVTVLADPTYTDANLNTEGWRNPLKIWVK